MMRMTVILASVLALQGTMTGQTIDFEGAQWIWNVPGAGVTLQSLPAGVTFFRAQVLLPERAQVTRADLLITVDNLFALYLNGHSVGESPTDTNVWQHPQRFDVTDLLVPGRNVVAVEAVNILPGPGGLIAKLEVELGSGQRVVLVSDARWTCSDQERLSWQQPGFDDSRWRPAQVVGPYGAAPWGRVTVAATTRPVGESAQRVHEIGKQVLAEQAERGWTGTVVEAPPGPDFIWPRALFVMNADGSDIRPLTYTIIFDNEPEVLADGRILFIRSDNFFDRGKVETRLHAIHPDGRGGYTEFGLDNGPEYGGRLRAFFCGSSAPLPDGRVAFVSGPGISIGRLGASSRHLEHFRMGAGGVAALPDGRLLCTLARTVPVEVNTGGKQHTIQDLRYQKIGVLDPRSRPPTVTIIHDVSTGALHSPVYLGPRLRPAVLADQGQSQAIPDVQATGFLFCQNVRFTKNTTAGWSQVRAIRVLAGQGLTTRSSHSYIVHAGNQTMELGTVPLAPDGSFSIEVPADTPLGRIGTVAAQDILVAAFARLQDYPKYTYCYGDHEALMACHASPVHYFIAESLDAVGSTRARSIVPHLIRSVPIDMDRALLLPNDDYETVIGRVIRQNGAERPVVETCLAILGDNKAQQDPDIAEAIGLTHRAWGGDPGPQNRAAQILSLTCRDRRYEPRIRAAFERYRQRPTTIPRVFDTGIPVVLNLPIQHWVCFYLARALGNLADPESADALMAVLRSTPTEAANGRPDPLGPGVLFLHNDLTPCWRAAVAWALGRIGDPRAVDVLLEVVEDLNNAPDARHAAARALGLINDGPSRARTRRLAQTYPEVSTRYALLEAVQGGIE